MSVLGRIVNERRQQKKMQAAAPALNKMMGQAGTSHIFNDQQTGMPVDLSTSGSGVMGVRPENQGVEFARRLMSIEGFEAEGMALLPQAFQNRAELFARMDHQEATLQQDQTQFDYAQQKQADQWQQNYNIKSAEWEAQKIRNTRQAFIDEQTLNDKNLSIQQKQAALEQADMTAATMPAQATAQLAPLMDFDTEYARQASTFKPEYAVASQFMLLSEFDLKQKAKNAKTDEEREMVAWWMRESAITSKIFNQISGAAVGEHEEARLNKSMLLPTMNAGLIDKIIRERYGFNREAIENWKTVWQPTFKRETPVFNPVQTFPEMVPQGPAVGGGDVPEGFTLIGEGSTGG